MVLPMCQYIIINALLTETASLCFAMQASMLQSICNQLVSFTALTRHVNVARLCLPSLYVCFRNMACAE